MLAMMYGDDTVWVGTRLQLGIMSRYQNLRLPITIQVRLLQASPFFS